MVKFCDFTNGRKCPKCGKPKSNGDIRNCWPNGTAPSPADPNYLAPWKPEKLGDWTERQLKKLGVTEERYKEAKEKFGLAAECNCAGRKEWLNKVSDWWQQIRHNTPDQDNQDRK